MFCPTKKTSQGKQTETRDYAQTNMYIYSTLYVYIKSNKIIFTTYKMILHFRFFIYLTQRANIIFLLDCVPLIFFFFYGPNK